MQYVTGEEEPVGDEEDQDEEADECPVDVDAGEGRPRPAVEDPPRPHRQGEQLEGQGHQHPVALDAALHRDAVMDRP